MKKILLACYLVLVSIALMIAPIHAENVDGEAVTEGEDYFFRFDGGEHEAELKISL